MSNKAVVLAIFKDEVSADAAAASLKDSGVAHGDAIGVLVLNEKGEVGVRAAARRPGVKGWRHSGQAPRMRASTICNSRTTW